MVLNKDWTPGFGELVTWFAMDKCGAIAVMVNNCFGSLPTVLLNMPGIDEGLDALNEFMWEESERFTEYPENKKGQTILDSYSAYSYRHTLSRQEVESWVSERSSFDSRLTEYSIPSIKGFYMYHGVEGSLPGEDFPKGYDGPTVMGDYFRYLMPSVFARIEDIPVELRGFVAVSDSLEFSKTPLIRSESVDGLFSKIYGN
ncbi:hypothetical protein HUS84_24585 [Pseudomonas chlororaphis]|uniref:hypothetical protein n=1 Tax=Pseudomonas chlororaphis TaxID=587753 RepID=UPI001B31920A|nr:hypothetical protein [Pseudomonas chlororaphis]MBP5077093.1 hypothetical protein [Pseudomonas chlororaphis]